MKKWIVRNPDANTALSLAQNSGLSELCSQVLVSRGISDINTASEFINPDIPENPFIMKDMLEAVETINNAVDSESKICVFGDYDCDGIVSTVMLVSYLEFIGADVSYYIPERSEGYGMNENAVRKIAENGTDLIITVDNGISAIAEAELISELGMKLIVTDHHQTGENLPLAAAVVNPHRNDCPSCFKELCGAGVVLKLISALEGGDYECITEQFGDIAAIATIGDVVSIKGENRYIVKKGLEMLRNTERPGLSALIEKCGMKNGSINSVSAAFMIVPRINASGRFASPKLAAELLMCENEEQAEIIADELNILNNQRKQAENDILLQIEKQINENPQLLSKRVLVFRGNNWHHGVIGIVAARITEHFGKPCFIITDEADGMSRGSARSFGSFSVFRCLDFCSELLVKFGGHMGAGGFSVKTSDAEAFDDKIQEYARLYHDIMPVFSVSADKIIMPDEINTENIKGLEVLEPFGEGNPEPLFIVNGAVVDNIVSLSNGLHTKLILKYGNTVFEALMFRTPPDTLSIRKGERWNFIVSFEINSYRGRESVSAKVRDYRKYGIKQNKYILSDDIYGRYLRNEINDSSLYSEICPSRTELTLVYKYLGNSSQNTDNMYFNLEPNGISLCKLKICLDIFRELGIVSLDSYNDTIKRIPVDHKVNLGNSEILRRLNELT